MRLRNWSLVRLPRQTRLRRCFTKERGLLPRVPGFLTTRVRVTAHRTHRAGGDRFSRLYPFGTACLQLGWGISAHCANGLAVELRTCYIPSPLTPLGILAEPWEKLPNIHLHVCPFLSQNSGFAKNSKHESSRSLARVTGSSAIGRRITHRRRYPFLLL